MEHIIDIVLNNFDYTYCIVVNILTYIIIASATVKGKDLKLWGKRLVLIGVILVLGIAYYSFGTSGKVVLNSAILAPVFWSWIMKPVCKKLGIDYNNINIFE